MLSFGLGMARLGVRVLETSLVRVSLLETMPRENHSKFWIQDS
jgi:hypothetical protein